MISTNQSTVSRWSRPMKYILSKHWSHTYDIKTQRRVRNAPGLSFESPTSIDPVCTRPTYPSSRLTFSIANLTKDKAIRFFNLGLILNEKYDIDVVLEDSKRNFLNSLIILILAWKYKNFQSSQSNHLVLLIECFIITKSVSREVRFS